MFSKLCGIILRNYYPLIIAPLPFLSLILSRKIPELLPLRKHSQLQLWVSGLWEAPSGLRGASSRPLHGAPVSQRHGCNSQWHGGAWQELTLDEPKQSWAEKTWSCAIFLLCLQKYHAAKLSKKKKKKKKKKKQQSSSKHQCLILNLELSTSVRPFSG